MNILIILKCEAPLSLDKYNSLKFKLENQLPEGYTLMLLPCEVSSVESFDVSPISEWYNYE